MRVVVLVLIVLWPATAQARWVGTAEQWADLQSRDAYGDMGNWFNSLSSKTAGSCCSNFDGRPPEAIVQTSDHHYQVMLEGQWVEPGVSGNPNGRPVGSRTGCCNPPK